MQQERSFPYFSPFYQTVSLKAPCMSEYKSFLSAHLLFNCLNFKKKIEKKIENIIFKPDSCLGNMQELYHRIFPCSLVPAHIFSSREGIPRAPPDPGCFPQAAVKQQEAKGPQALPSPCKDYQFALVTTNLLPSPSFLRALCLGTVAGLRLLCCYLSRLPTKEITGDWQAAPHSVGFGGVCVRDCLSSGTAAIKF